MASGTKGLMLKSCNWLFFNQTLTAFCILTEGLSTSVTQRVHSHYVGCRVTVIQLMDMMISLQYNHNNEINIMFRFLISLMKVHGLEWVRRWN